MIDPRELLDCLARTDSPFVDEVRDLSVTFVQPQLVAENGFTE